MKRAILTIFAVLALAACSGGGGGEEPKSATDLATKAGCTGYTKGESQMFTQETGECSIDGQTVYVMTFADKAARDNWMKTAKAAGASGFYGEGDTWVLQGDDKASVEKGTKAAGGSLAS